MIGKVRATAIGILMLFTAAMQAQCCTNGVNMLAGYNPDFSIPGNPIPPGFDTDNEYSPFLSAGLYSVIVSRDYGACFGTPQYDHTFGNEQGHYLWYDTEGTTTVANPEVAWRPFDPTRPPGQENTLDVMPNTTYVFSVWIRDLAREADCISGGAPVMGLRINGVDMAEIDLADYTSPCCPEWIYLCTEWQSGNSTQVLIEIESRSGFGWTDLGIDDVYFGTTSPFQEGVLGDDIVVCSPQTITLDPGVNFGEFLWSTGETTSSIEVDTPGTYWVDVIQEGCSGRDSINVVIGGDPPQINLGADITTCQGTIQTLTFQANQPGEVLWNTGATTSSIQVNTAGTYSIILSNECGNATDEVAVDFVPPPTLEVSPANALLCSGEFAQLEAIPGNNESVVWNTGNTGTILQVSAPGIYEASVSNICGLTTAVATVAVGNAPLLDLGADRTACEGTALLLAGIPGQGSYAWNTGATTPQLTVTTAGTYELTITNACGTVSDAVEVVYISPLSIDLGSDISACEGESVTLSVQAPGADIAWNTGATGASLTITEGGVYSVEVDNGCTIEDQVSINFLPLPELNLADSVLVCPGQDVTVNAGGGAFSYLWSNGAADSTVLVQDEEALWVRKFNACGSISDTVSFIRPEALVLPEIADTVLCLDTEWLLTFDVPTFPILWDNGSSEYQRVFNRPGVYTLSASNACGLESETFRVDYKPCNCDVYLPNAFTPDNDGVNDVFFVQTECPFELFEFSIFNRWGERLFSTSDPEEEWDGGVKEYYTPDGVYTYTIKYQLPGGELTDRYGFVVLIR